MTRSVLNTAARLYPIIAGQGVSQESPRLSKLRSPAFGYETWSIIYISPVIPLLLITWGRTIIGYGINFPTVSVFGASGTKITLKVECCLS